MKSKLPIFLLAIAGNVLAESETLPLVVVTATRTEQSEDESLASVSVITREDIDKKQPLSVQDALVGIPGINISNQGGLGKNSSVFMRGTNSDQVLVLVDGVRMGSATTGTTAFQDIPIDQIEHIEIVRGPRSSLYGSEAIGGVIQIFTRKGGGGLKPFLSLGGGTNSTYKASGGVSGGDEQAWFNFSLAELYTGGINACNGIPSNADGSGGAVVSPMTRIMTAITTSQARPARVTASTTAWRSRAIFSRRQGTTNMTGATSTTPPSCSKWPAASCVSAPCLSGARR